jgi:hypothetical protein
MPKEPLPSSPLPYTWPRKPRKPRKPSKPRKKDLVAFRRPLKGLLRALKGL